MKRTSIFLLAFLCLSSIWAQTDTLLLARSLMRTPGTANFRLDSARFLYDSQQRISTETFFSWDKDSSSYDSTRRVFTAYVADTLETIEQKWNPTGQVWNNDFLLKSYTDSANFVSHNYKFLWNESISKWDSGTKEFTYLNQYFQDTFRIQYGWSNSDNTWVPSRRIRQKWDPNFPGDDEKLTFSLSEFNYGPGVQFQFVSKRVYEYDNQARQVLYERWDEEFGPTRKESRFFSNGGMKMVQLVESALATGQAPYPLVKRDSLVYGYGFAVSDERIMDYDSLYRFTFDPGGNSGAGPWSPIRREIRRRSQDSLYSYTEIFIDSVGWQKFSLKVDVYSPVHGQVLESMISDWNADFSSYIPVIQRLNLYNINGDRTHDYTYYFRDGERTLDRRWRWYYRTQILLPVDPDEESSLRVYPNPASQMIQVKIPNGEHISGFRLLDLRGQTLLQGDLQDRETLQVLAINLGSIPTGTYILLLEGKDSLYQQKIQKH
ncbi:MAG: T9SS type A sorting domain-containing protein [Bacteroidia bacterium]|nr:T9SS type A sorting domain-containing protein [Bacteroidia bacterium]